MNGFISRISIQLHSSVCISSCQYHSVLFNVAVCCVDFLSKNCFSSLGSLEIPHFRVSYSAPFHMDVPQFAYASSTEDILIPVRFRHYE